MMSRLKIKIVVTLLVLSVAAVSARAQTANVWERVCADANDARSCRITQELFVTRTGADGTEQVAGRILGLHVLYAVEETTGRRLPYLSVQMPMGVDLRPGAVLKVDQGADIPIQYLRCTEAGCDASIQLQPALLQALQAGKELFVGFRAWGSEETTVLSASLIGFSKAYAALQ